MGHEKKINISAQYKIRWTLLYQQIHFLSDEENCTVVLNVIVDKKKKNNPGVHWNIDFLFFILVIF